jgi:hypothetical protein
MPAHSPETMRVPIARCAESNTLFCGSIPLIIAMREGDEEDDVTMLRGWQLNI